MKTFNSTRYIRNRRPLRNFPTGTQLSTPHGTLGTATPSSASSGFLCFQLHTVHQERSIYKPVRSYQKNFQLHTVHQEQRHKRISLSPLFTFNSTRYIRNISPEERLREKLKKSFNSTRYIRNFMKELQKELVSYAFNSTRYIRNCLVNFKQMKKVSLSTPHGTLGTNIEGYKEV